MFRMFMLASGLAFVAIALFNACRSIFAYLHARNAKGPMKQRIRDAKWIWRA